MVEPATPPRLAEQALLAAVDAASRAGVTVVEIDGVAELHAAASLIARIWATGAHDAPVSPDLLRALSHAGGYVAAARHGDSMVGASVALLAEYDGESGLHSHITGVAPGRQSRSVGFALKQHQRAWALARGIHTIRWTFDPLVRRNGYFNLGKLAAVVHEFHRDFYGTMSDGINAGDRSDRAIATWRLAAPAVAQASERRPVRFDVDALRRAGAGVVLGPGDRPAPRFETVEAAPSAPCALLCWVPEDFTALRADEAGTARAWREAFAEVFSSALAAGYSATSMTRDGWYVLEHA